MKQIILLATYLPASKQTLAQFIALAGRTWLTNRMCEHSNKNYLFPSLPYMRMRVYQIIPKWATKDGIQKKTPILYRNNELYEIAKRAREQDRECFYIKKTESQECGTHYIEVSEEKVPLLYNIKFTLPEDIYSQYSGKYLAPTIYKVRSYQEMKDVMNEVLSVGLLYEEDWIDFYHDDERIAVGFRPLCDGLTDRITYGLETL